MQAAPRPLATSEAMYPMKMPMGEAKVKGRTTLQKRRMLRGAAAQWQCKMTPSQRCWEGPGSRTA